MHISILWWVLLGGVYGASIRSSAWWDSAVVYQLNVRSFKDSNGDGIGDLNGLNENLQYFKNTGVDAIWLSPIYKSHIHDFGYDIIDYKEIASEYGTMEDFENLVAKAKKMGIRIILDFVPNHTSDENIWFKQSILKNPDYVEYYIWSDGKNASKSSNQSEPPNNWLSVSSGSAWEFNDIRMQYYLHQFGTTQPDLNYRNNKVRTEIEKILRFWLDKNVSGFCMHAANLLFEANPTDHGGTYPDEPLYNSSPESYDLRHIYTKNLNENYEIIYQWRSILDEYKKKEPKILLTEAYTDIDETMRFYGEKNREGSIPLNFFFLDYLTLKSNALDIKLVIDHWMLNMPVGKPAVWMNGNHDRSRLATRHGVDRVDAMNMLSLILPGVTITYQGEEIGMTDGAILFKTGDPRALTFNKPISYWLRNRVPERTPFHWDDTQNAGFTKGVKTWLPVADNYITVNLRAQKNEAKSHYKFYKDMVAVKHLPVVRNGYLQTKVSSNNTLIITRLLPGFQAVVGLINLSDSLETVDLSGVQMLPQELRVIASGVNCLLDKGDTIQKQFITLIGHCAITFESFATCC